MREWAGTEPGCLVHRKSGIFDVESVDEDDIMTRDDYDAYIMDKQTYFQSK